MMWNLNEKIYPQSLMKLIRPLKYYSLRTISWPRYIHKVLGYDFSSPSIASSSTTVFVSPANNVESENNDAKTVLASDNID